MPDLHFVNKKVRRVHFFLALFALFGLKWDSMETTMKEKTDTLKEIYGSHKRAAAQLGVGKRTYQYYRHGERIPSKVFEILVDMILSEHERQNDE